MFFYIGSTCQTAVHNGISALPVRANRWSPCAATRRQRAPDAAWPTGDIALPTMPKSRWDQSKKQPEGRNDEGFCEQARGLAARRFRCGSPHRSCGIAQSYPSHNITAIIPVRARQRQRHHRAHRARAGRQAARPADRHRQPRRRRRHHRRRPGGARDAGRLHHPVPFGLVQRRLRDAQDAALRHVQRLHCGGARSAFRRACWWSRRRRATRPPPI